MRVAPGWGETEAAVSLAKRLAAQANTELERSFGCFRRCWPLI